MTRPRLALRLAIAYVAVFLWMGVYLPYWPVRLAERGMSPSEVGILLGVAPWTRVIASPLAGSWADRRGRADRLIVGLAIAVVIGQACFTLADGFGGLLLITVAVGLAFAPIIPLLDGLTVTAEAEGRVSYGPVRLWGSAAFIGGSWIGGELLEHRGEAIVLWLLVGAAAATAVASLWLPSGPKRSQRAVREDLAAESATLTPSAVGGDLAVVSATPPPSTEAGPDDAKPSGFSATSRAFVGFLGVTALLHGSHAVLYAFGTQHWRTQGIDEGTAGLLWAEGVLAEILLFAAARRVDDWLSPRALWLLAGAAGAVRWAVLGWTSALPWLVATQGLHALTYGALHLGAMAYIRQRVPSRARARATTLYSAAATGLALGIALPLAGWLYERLDGTAYWVMAGCSAIAMLLALGLREAGREPERSSSDPSKTP